MWNPNNLHVRVGITGMSKNINLNHLNIECYQSYVLPAREQEHRVLYPTPCTSVGIRAKVLVVRRNMADTERFS